MSHRYLADTQLPYNAKLRCSFRVLAHAPEMTSSMKRQLIQTIATSTHVSPLCINLRASYTTEFAKLLEAKRAPYDTLGLATTEEQEYQLDKQRGVIAAAKGKAVQGQKFQRTLPASDEKHRRNRNRSPVRSRPPSPPGPPSPPPSPPVSSSTVEHSDVEPIDQGQFALDDLSGAKPPVRWWWRRPAPARPEDSLRDSPNVPPETASAASSSDAVKEVPEAANTTTKEGPGSRWSWLPNGPSWLPSGAYWLSSLSLVDFYGGRAQVGPSAGQGERIKDVRKEQGQKQGFIGSLLCGAKARAERMKQDAEEAERAKQLLSARVALEKEVNKLHSRLIVTADLQAAIDRAEMIEDFPADLLERGKRRLEEAEKEQARHREWVMDQLFEIGDTPLVRLSLDELAPIIDEALKVVKDDAELTTTVQQYQERHKKAKSLQREVQKLRQDVARFLALSLDSIVSLSTCSSNSCQKLTLCKLLTSINVSDVLASD